jgi:hypothetical protein
MACTHIEAPLAAHGVRLGFCGQSVRRVAIAPPLLATCQRCVLINEKRMRLAHKKRSRAT